MKKILLLLVALAAGIFSVSAQVGEFTIETFEGGGKMTFPPFANAGAFTINTSGAPTGNGSATFGQYNRNAGVFYDYLAIQLTGNAQGVSSYYPGTTKQISMKIWTSAPVGTHIEVTLDNHNLALGGYPTGRHSNYGVNTTTSNAWETIVFTYQFRPDGSVSDAIIDQMTFAFAQPSNTGDVFYIDDIKGFDISGAVVPVNSKEYLWTDFNGVDPLTFTSSDGTLTTGVANPAQGPNHLLATVAKYDRTTAQYDVLKMGFDGILQNMPDYKANLRKFAINVYSPAPGTNVEFTLENSGLSFANYPNGRYAYFNGTTVGTGWERVVLSYGATIDPTVTVAQIDQVSIRFNSNSFLTTTVYVDSIYGPTIAANPAIVGEYVIENFDGTSNVTYNGSPATNGTFTNNLANPHITGLDVSAKVGQYVRNAGVQYDVLSLNLKGNVIGVSDYVAGTKQMSMLVWTSAPPGSVVEITLASAAASPFNYPTGRHSVYQAATTVQNGWNLLKFNWFLTPTGVDDASLEKMYIGFNRNSFTGDTWLFDDLKGFALSPFVVIPNRDFLWSTFSGATDRLLFVGADGQLSQAANPDASGVDHKRSTVGKYVRSGVTYDVLRWKWSAPITNLASYKNNTIKWSIDVYSPAVGTTIQFTLQNATGALGGYPSGRAAEFVGTTITAGGWETVTLNYSNTPDPSITQANINEIAVLINPGNASSTTLYFDTLFGPQFTPVAVQASGVTWTGAVSNDWNTVGNWAGQIGSWKPGYIAGAGIVPTSTTQVTIPANLATPYPVLAGSYSSGPLTVSKVNGLTVNSGTLAVTGDFTLGAGASAFVASGATISFTSDINGGAGSAVTGGGRVLATGSSNQFATGSVTVPNFTLNKTGGQFKVNNPSSLRIQPNATSNSTLDIQGTSYLGAFAPVQNGGKIILGSNSFGTARMLLNGTATFDGVLTQERFVGSVGWHFVSMPFNQGTTPLVTTVADFNEAGVRVNPKNNANIFKYTEPDTTNGTYNLQLTEQHGWKVPALTDQTSATVGYRLYTNAKFLSLGGVLSTTGAPMRNNVPAGFTFTPAGGFGGGGWNLLANPYSCEIDWAATRFDVNVNNQNAPMGTFINVWNPSNGNYATFTATDASSGVGVNGGTQVVGSSQAFFIKASGGPSQIIFREANKVTTGGTNFLRKAETSVIRLNLVQGTSKDEAAIMMGDKFSAGTDMYDAANLGSGVDVFTMPATGQELAIAALPTLASQVEIPVYVGLATTGDAHLVVSGLETFSDGAQAYLRDAFLNKYVAVGTSLDYAFSVTSNPASKGATRFTIVVAPASVTAVKGKIAASILAYPNPSQDKITIAPSTGSMQHIAVRDIVGHTVYTWNGNAATLPLSISAWAPGLYTVEATTTVGSFQTKFKKE